MAQLHWNVKNVAGRRFGKLVALSYRKGSTWLCQCDCGNKHIVRTGRLMNGMTKSCGCLISEVLDKRNRTHGQPKDKAYHAWAHMIQRCTNPANKSYAIYGGRGICVCERWMSYENFLADMGRPEDERLTIERSDNARGYEPGNVRWASRTEQSRNRRNVRSYTHRGRTMTLPEWAEYAGLKDETLRYRLKRGWAFEDAVETPTRL